MYIENDVAERLFSDFDRDGITRKSNWKHFKSSIFQFLTDQEKSFLFELYHATDEFPIFNRGDYVKFNSDDQIHIDSMHYDMLIDKGLMSFDNDNYYWYGIIRDSDDYHSEFRPYSTKMKVDVFTLPNVHSDTDMLIKSKKCYLIDITIKTCKLIPVSLKDIPAMIKLHNDG